MATTFELWEKDPFFAAAEEVQDSADRLESVYRQWVQERKNASAAAEFVSAELKRELHTAFGTAKWQLEEFERAVRSNDEALSAGKYTRARHGQFVLAIGNRISAVENSLRETNLVGGQNTLTWVRLDEGEQDQFAQFLSYPLFEERKDIPVLNPSAVDLKVGDELIRINGEDLLDCSKDSFRSTMFSSLSMKDEKMHGCRRTASCAGDIGACAITIPSEGEDTSERSSDDRPNPPPPSRALSSSALSSSLDSTSKMRWLKNGYRKWRVWGQDDVVETIPLRNHEQTTQGFNACYARSKSCLGCEPNTYNKHLYGYLGAFKRLLQRFYYQIQYGDSVKIILWTTLVIFLIVIVVLRASK